MRALKSLFRAIPTSISFLVIAIAVALAAAKVSIRNAEDFGFVYGKEHGFAEQQSLVVTAISKEVYGYAVASRVGGVILQAVAQPELASGKLSIVYDRNAEDGHRFKITVGKETSEILAPDWEMIPLIRFVNT